MATSFGAMFIQGGWVMWPLLLFSILTWAVILERAYVYLSFRPKLNKLVNTLQTALKTGDLATAKQVCHSTGSFIGEMFLGALDTTKPRESLERTVDRNKLRTVNYLKKNLWILGTIGSASPFVGLLGTVVGIVKAFRDMGEKGAGGFSVVASGISEALIATAAGLVVAIIAVLTYNIFVTLANQTVSQLKLAIEETLDSAQGGH